MPTVFPNADDEFTTPSQPTTTVLASAGDSTRNHVQHHQDLGDAIDSLEKNVALLTHDHSAGTAKRATRQLVQANTHNEADTDAGPLAIHHTLGPRHNNAAPGDHTHPEATPYVPPVETWVKCTPPLYYGGGMVTPSPAPGDQYPVNLGVGGYSVGYYILIGSHLHLEFNWVWGQPPYNGGFAAIYTYLPSPFISSRANNMLNHAFAKLFTMPRTGPLRPPHTGQNWVGDAYLPPGTNLVSFAFPWATNDCSLANYRMTLNQGVTDQGVPYIPGGFPEGGELYCRVDLEVETSGLHYFF